MTRVLAILLLFLWSTSAASAEEGGELIGSIDFDTFVDGIPEGMVEKVSATTGDAGVYNRFEQDTVVFVDGGSSLRISGGDANTHWRTVMVDLPCNDVERVCARLYVKGEDLGLEGNQFDNCYAGFWFDGLSMGNDRILTPLPRGTFDWTEVTVSLDLDAQLARNVSFNVFSSISGTLWVDELTFLYDEDCPQIEQREVRGPLAEYIDRLHKPTTFMELADPPEGDCPDSISASEALEDVEMLQYLLENGYSGYTYWKRRGMDFDAIYTRLHELAREGGAVSVADMERIIADGLSDVQDGHLYISGHREHRFLRRTNPYFADVIVERVGREEEDGSGAVYRVVRSSCDSVRPGMFYVGPDERLFRILSRRGVEQYQLGVFTEDRPRNATFGFLGMPLPVVSLRLPLHECRLRFATQRDERVFYTYQVDGIDVVRIGDFSYTADSSLREFVQSGADFAESDRLIVDLTGNGGGNSWYAEEFVKALNGEADWRMYHAFLCSPVTVASMEPVYAAGASSETIEHIRHNLELLRDNPVRNWLYVVEELRPRRMGDYQGRAVFLFDRGVASSGEALIDCSKSIPGVVLVGENSCGVGTFGDVRGYWLPNSGIGLSLPCKLFLAPGIEEGVGYLPDYWIDSPEPVAEIARWLNSPDTYQFELP